MTKQVSFSAAMIAVSLALGSAAGAQPSDQSQATQVRPDSESMVVGAGQATHEDMLRTLMEYQKVMAQEVRENRKVRSEDARRRMRIPDAPQKSELSICEAAKLARDRNSPAAPGLTQQCTDSGSSSPQ